MELGHIKGMQPLLMLLITPVLSLCLNVKMATVTKMYSTSVVIHNHLLNAKAIHLHPLLLCNNTHLNGF